METLVTDLQNALTALQSALATAQTPAIDTTGDQVLAAIVPVLEGAGWTQPATVTNIPVTDANETETPAEDASEDSAEEPA